MICTLYYHLFPGQSIEKILHEHLVILKEYNAFDQIIIEAWDVSDEHLKLVTDFSNSLKEICDIILNLNTVRRRNEFATLISLQNSLPKRNVDDWVAFAHTKGVTHPQGTAVHTKSVILMRNLNFLALLLKTNKNFRDFYNVVGTDLTWANIKEFGPAQLTFAGMCWAARVDYLTKLPKIPKLVMFDVASRFESEGWIGLSLDIKPFNGFCPYRYHYDNHPKQLNSTSIEDEIKIFIDHEHLWNITQDYFNSALELYHQKIDSLLKRAYPKTFFLRKNLYDFLNKHRLQFPILKILMSILYRMGILRSRFGLFTIDVPSQLNIYKYLKQANNS